MQRTTAILGSAIFFVIAPCVAIGLIPYWITHWQFQGPFFGLEPTRLFGVALIMGGIAGVVDSFARFAIEGLGTPAPVAPPRHLVVTGLYRYVRNPMYVAILVAVAGQALHLGDWRLIAYGALFWFAAHLYVTLYEEPTLQRKFGASYTAFCSHVPRWVPRTSPWTG
jgi:protein-S-isoprenylcysteine O-methyltransferase Ste14